MASRFAKQSYSLMDAKGQVARVVFGVNYDDTEAAPSAWTLGQGMAAALAGASNGFLFSASGPYAFVLPKQYGARADYVDAEDKAVLTYQDNNGGIHRFSIPMPKAALFMADGQTVSATSPELEAITTALIAVEGGSASFGGRGSTFSQAPAGFIAGQRERRKTQRRITLWTLSGGLDEPAE